MTARHKRHEQAGTRQAAPIVKIILVFVIAGVLLLVPLLLTVASAEAAQRYAELPELNAQLNAGEERLGALVGAVVSVGLVLATVGIGWRVATRGGLPPFRSVLLGLGLMALIVGPAVLFATADIAVPGAG